MPPNYVRDVSGGDRIGTVSLRIHLWIDSRNPFPFTTIGSSTIKSEAPLPWPVALPGWLVSGDSGA